MTWRRRAAWAAIFLIACAVGLWIGYTVRTFVIRGYVIPTLGADVGDRTFVALVAAGAALVGGIIGGLSTSWVQHKLSLREDRIKRQRDEEERRKAEVTER